MSDETFDQTRGYSRLNSADSAISLWGRFWHLRNMIEIAGVIP
jgi:hypothetical protein